MNCPMRSTRIQFNYHVTRSSTHVYFYRLLMFSAMDRKIPRLNAAVSDTTLNDIILQAFRDLGYDQPTDQQSDVVREFVSGKDVFVVQPTGSVKSLCYVCLPVVFRKIHSCTCVKDTEFMPIVVVISPLVCLMKDQVQKYSKAGVI